MTNDQLSDEGIFFTSDHMGELR